MSVDLWTCSILQRRRNRAEVKSAPRASCTWRSGGSCSDATVRNTARSIGDREDGILFLAALGAGQKSAHGRVRQGAAPTTPRAWPTGTSRDKLWCDLFPGGFIIIQQWRGCVPAPVALSQASEKGP
jgi:hypothetical protein